MEMPCNILILKSVALLRRSGCFEIPLCTSAIIFSIVLSDIYSAQDDGSYHVNQNYSRQEIMDTL